MKKIILILTFIICLTGCTSDQTMVHQHLYKVINHDGHIVYILGTNHQAKKIEELDSMTEKVMDESDILYTEIPMDLDKIQQIQQAYMNVNSASEVLNDKQMKRLEKIKDDYHSLSLIDYKNIQLMYLSSICQQEILSSLGYTSLGIDSYIYDHFKG